MSTELSAPLLLGIVGVLAGVQSVFGVGLLVFGTPTLLVLGVPFDAVLAYLLPSSLAISVLQVATSGGLTLEPIRAHFLRLTMPALVVVTAVVLRAGSPRGIRALVGVMLVATALMRLLAPLQRLVAAVVRRQLRPLLLLLGVLHGLSNLGGGLLTVIAGATYDDKAQIRRHIAFCYGGMAAAQLAVLLLTDSPDVSLLLVVAAPLVAASVYVGVGQRLFARAGQIVFQRCLTGVIAGFGVLLLAHP